MIRLLRVDHRLLHGQVVFTWAKTTGSDCILIANDSVVKDEIRKSMLKLSKPEGGKLVFKSIADSVKAINEGKTDKYKLLILVDNLADAEKLALSCPAVTSVNLGGLKQRAGTRALGPAFYVTEEECAMLRNMIRNGVEAEVRQVPTDSKVVVNEQMIK